MSECQSKPTRKHLFQRPHARAPPLGMHKIGREQAGRPTPRDGMTRRRWEVTALADDEVGLPNSRPSRASNSLARLKKETGVRYRAPNEEAIEAFEHPRIPPSPPRTP